MNEVARRLGVPPARVALAWLLRDPELVVIPKASNLAHVRENRAAADLVLDTAALEVLDRAFAPPRRKRPLEMI